MNQALTQELLSFIQKNPTAFHTVAAIRQALMEQGYQELLESRKWVLERGRCYFVCRNQSSIIAFQIGAELSLPSFHIIASHSDSPYFKIKENAELYTGKKYTRLNTEGYGGMICSSWLDRPLSIAGRVLVRDENGISACLLNIDRDLVLIPNVAIHMNRSINDGFTFNKQVDLLPLFGGDCGENALKRLIAEELSVKEGDILGSDLSLYSRTPPSIWGRNGEFVSCGRLDDQQCVFSSLKALIGTKNPHSVNVLACFDNEEVGSGTKQGAGSTFLNDVLRRICSALGLTYEDYLRGLASSFMLSADNAHAVHPNHPEHTDANNCVYMNEGVVVKSHAAQKYTSDGVSIAVVRSLAEKAGVPLQYFANRSDKIGGSTLGNIAMSQVSMNTADIGLAQLAMHSAYETAGTKDTFYIVELMKALYECELEETGYGYLSIR